MVVHTAAAQAADDDRHPGFQDALGGRALAPRPAPLGERLFLSPHVSTHLYRLFPKISVTSVAALRDAPEQQNRHCRTTGEIAPCRV
jgi:hypothetical protein